MNAVIERWVQSCRRELLDRCLIWNERRLRHALRELNSSTTSTEPTKPGLRRHHCVLSQIRSPIRSESTT
ncbi:hypothetical protein [Nonomuraea sediminis]|uniref:hypothetical protein n=1 Tax=Nonomuraea sediminis TaxID=2835864 RepID=UPI001BDCF241|nr:hypothetical protein [Nonomuraea sediminis]